MAQGRGRVVVVTGAGSGVGRAVTTACLEADYAVVLVGRDRGRLEEAAAAHPHAMVVPGDVREGADVDHVFRAVEDAHGRIDVLFNNAGVFGPSGTPDEVDPAGWADTVATNLTGSFLCARAAFALMRRQEPMGGRIINNGSISAHAPRPGSVAYTATKHAITGLTKSISLDGRPFGIACGQIDIGNAGTDMTAAMAHGTPQADGSLRPEPTFPVRHAAEAVLFMAGLPLDANIQFLTVTATTMPYIGRG